MVVAEVAAGPRQKCRWCGVSLASTFFPPSLKARRMCSCCNSDANKRRYAAAVLPAELPKEKCCSRCGIVKAREEFANAKGSSDGLQSQCQPCHVLAVRESRAGIAAVPAPAAALPPTKSCRVCGQEKPRTAFYSDPSRGDGLRGLCRQCVGQYDSARDARQRAASRRALPPPPAPDSALSAGRWAPHHTFG